MPTHGLSHADPSAHPNGPYKSKRPSEEDLLIQLLEFGSPTRARTWDLRINSPSLYQLSYQGIAYYYSVFPAHG